MVDYFINNYGHLEHGFIYLFGNYFVAAGIVCVYADFKKRPKWKQALKISLHILCCIIALELLSALAYLFITSLVAYFPYVGGAVIIAVYTLFFTKENVWIRFIKSGTYYGMMCLTLNTTMSLGRLLGVEYYFLQWVLICVNASIIALTVVVLRYFSLKSYEGYSRLYPVLVVVINLIFMVYVIISCATPIEAATSLVLSLLLLFADIIIYLVISYVLIRTNEDAYRRAEELMRESDSELLRMSEKNLETMREMRHELKNQYAYMRVLLENKDFDALGNYMTEYLGKVEQTVNYVDCGNATINAVICAESSKIERAGAKADYRISVPPVLGIKDLDLCSLMMNLIDNAVEYIERNPDISDKTINIMTELINSTLLVTVDNAIKTQDEKSALGLKTSKPIKEAHGYGSKIVKKIAERYNGYVKYTVEKGKFTANALLCEKQREQ